jgi:hypothetical protein
VAYLISDKDVEHLNSHSFPAVMNALLAVEANFRRVPLGDLDLTTRVTDPDAGIDGRIGWPDGAIHDVLRPGTIVVQYKSGPIRKGDIRREFLKAGVQDALKSKTGRYTLFASHPYGGRTKDKHRKQLRELCRRRRIDPDRCSIFYGDHIARWISRLPSVAIMPELGRGYPGFSTVREWQRDQNLSNPFKGNAQRDGVMAALQSFANSTTADNIFRVEGHAGVGKTRLVLEALRLHGLAESTLYCPNAPDAQQFLMSLQANPEATAVVVLDECDYDQQVTLSSYARLASGRLRLICVGQADKAAETPPGLGNVFRLVPLTDEEMGSIATDFAPQAPREIADMAVRLSGGMPKLAVFIVDTLVKYKNLPLTDLINVHSVRSFLDRFVEPETYKSLKGLSLLSKVGWEGDLEIEARTIAVKALEQPFKDLRAAVVRLRYQGVVLPRGRYLYVSPDLLAISAAAALWEESGADLIDIIADLPGQGPCRQLLSRLAIMTDCPEVKAALQRLLSTKGLYKTIDDLDLPLPSEIFRYLSAALPEEGLEALNRLFRVVPDERLLDFREGRRETIWALESLLRWPQTSLGAARIIFRLALAENETVANSATGVLQQYFFAFLSGSPIPLGERLHLVDELLTENDPAKRRLAVKAAGAALSFFESRMGQDVDVISQRKFPEEWKPKTFEELHNARRIAIKKLALISDGSDEAAVEATEALHQSVFALMRHGQVHDAVSILRDHPPRNDKERLQAIDSAQRILKELPASLDQDERTMLEKIAAESFGASYVDRLRRWVGRRANTDYDLDGGTGFTQADRNVEQLAEEGFASGISGEEIGWLASPGAENVWIFGRRLGELDRGGSYIERILRATPSNLNCVFLSAYLSGLAMTAGNEVVDKILNDLEDTDRTLAFAATWRVGPSDEGGQRIIRLMRSASLDPDLYAALEYGNWVAAIPEQSGLEIIELMLDQNNPRVIQSVVAILGRMVGNRPDEVEKLQGIVWRALEAAPTNQGTMGDWYWGQLAKKMALRIPLRTAASVLTRMEKDDALHIGSDPIVEVLLAATREDPAAVWELVGKALLRHDRFAYRLLLALEKSYGELIPIETLIHWAREHVPRGPGIAARLLVVSAPLSAHARELVSALPDNEEILNVFATSLQTGFFMGSISQHMEKTLGTVRGWETDENPRIREWARNLASYLAKQIKEQKLTEEGEQF